MSGGMTVAINYDRHYLLSNTRRLTMCERKIMTISRFLSTALVGICLQLMTLLPNTSQAEFKSNEVYLNQGWNAADRNKAYTENLGAELIPYDWFMALEQADTNTKFIDHINEFGLISQPGQLPIGVTVDENEITGKLYGSKKWIGVNCAVCHTSLLAINNHKIVIDGNQGLINLQNFEEGILQAVQSTLDNEAKFERFIKNLKSADSTELRKNLELFKSEFGGWNKRNHHYFDDHRQEVRFGPGRLDGFSGATNDFSCYPAERLGNSSFSEGLLFNLKNCQTAQAPVSFPYLWGMVYQEHVQWNAQVHASLGRNVGAMMAGYGKNWVERSFFGPPKVKTSINIKKVAEIEDLYRKLTPPLWRYLSEAQIVAEIDQVQAKRGQKIYQTQCQSCHAIEPELTVKNKFGNSYWKTKILKTKDIGTDENYTRDEYRRRAKISLSLAPLYNYAFGEGTVDKNITVPAEAARGMFPGFAILNYFVENNYSQADKDSIQNCREGLHPQKVEGIKAKSLDGVIFTAPYLHNGSVPTIWDLLSDESSRPSSFWIGCNKYDSVKMGFDCSEADANVFEFKTSLQGNSNQGHLYGTDLNDNEKMALIEYLKTLEQPAAPPQNPKCH